MKRRLLSLAAGVTAVVAATALGILVVVILGFRERPSLVFLVAAVAVAAGSGWAAQHRLEALPFRLGAVAAGGAAAAADIVSANPGIGSGQAAALAVAVAVALAGPRVLTPLTRPLPGWLLAVGLATLVFVLVRVVIGGGGLGHDESAYALKARAWLYDTPHTGWDIHRGVALSLLAATVLPFTDSAVALRLVSVVLSVGTVVAVWWLGRTVRSHRAGIVAAAVFAVAPSFLRRGAEFLTDAPSTGLLVIVAALLWRWAAARRPRQSTLMSAAVVAAVAFYVRYQSVLSIGLLLVTVAAVAWPRVRREGTAIAWAGGLGLVLLVPHFVYATLETGTPWGVLTETGGAGGREYLGEGIVDYLSLFPDLLAGQVGAVAILLALVWFGVRMVAALRAGGLGQEGRVAVFLVVPALGQILALGLISHGEPRFVFFPVALLMVATGVAVEDMRRRVPRPLYRAGVVATVMAVIAGMALSADRIDRNAEARAASTEILLETASAVLAESEGRCGIVTSYTPQLTWFSGCQTELFDRAEVDVELDESLDRFVVFFDNGKRQPTGDVREGYESLAEDEPIVLDDETDSIGDAEIYPLDR